MKKELDMRLLNQITGGADEEAALFALEPTIIEITEEDNTQQRNKSTYIPKPFGRRPRNNTPTLEPVEELHLALEAIVVP